jgi:hypothetical protein
MPETGSGVISGSVSVVKAGTRQRMPALAAVEGVVTFAKTVTIQALSTNEGKVAVGGATVVAAVGNHASPTSSGVLLNAGDTISLDIGDMASIFLDSTVTGDGVQFVALGS